MSEFVGRMQRALAQAKGFTEDAPLEAVARTELVVRELEAALPSAPHTERAELEALRALAVRRLETYRALEQTFRKEATTRANLFGQHERERLADALPVKV